MNILIFINFKRVQKGKRETNIYVTDRIPGKLVNMKEPELSRMLPEPTTPMWKRNEPDKQHSYLHSCVLCGFELEPLTDRNWLGIVRANIEDGTIDE